METRVKEPCYVGVRMHQESGSGVRNMEKKSAQAKQEDRESLPHRIQRVGEREQEQWKTWVGTKREKVSSIDLVMV